MRSHSAAPPAPGAFVTGTDTDVGKTLVSAILVKAWQADYWKPYQTGVADACSDTDTVAALLGPGGHTLHPPACILQAPLAPWAAARLEGVALNAADLRLPRTQAPLVVEGAGGLYVPIDERHMMLDLAARLGLPLVLVTRSTLGTINHTLLSLQALAARQLPVMGVIMNGPLSPGNRKALEHFGHTRILAEIPPLPRVDAAAIARMAAGIPPLASILPSPPPCRSQPDGITKNYTSAHPLPAQGFSNHKSI
ncbi:MAG: dethiobiotin synthase [Castellaniella sp.]|uniref:dethiobiotin synthase n=1 Tax=Castellaniella sp. TaxID=1955812 RepID=UPI003C7331A4